ncbi:MAG: tRNA (adenosine(37)-N6)-threonylcarbamoyltransferase complex dimerization subunit type 1 TsaB [Gammaproteobacteria bacterium]|nr:tRNA (adenosine(37)-N6)-threonylcarbamoyltransferase complex dimerization subunit type 1 TsaB [Gammaproteobacteria bacterium]
MKLLAIDTSTEACSVALQVGSERLHLDEVCPQQHSKRVLPMVQQLLTQAGLSLQQLDGIVFGRGPGSFTGVRIGVGVTQGLAFGADLPVYGVSTLAAMAQAAYRLHGAAQVIAAIDARMAEIYLGYFALDSQLLMQPVTAELAIKPTALIDCPLIGDCFAVGTGWQTYRDMMLQWQAATICEQILYPSAQDMLTLAAPALSSGQFIAAELAEPVYVRDEVTWKKLPGRG